MDKGGHIREMTNVTTSGTLPLLSGCTARGHSASPLPEAILIETAAPLFGKPGFSGFGA